MSIWKYGDRVSNIIKPIMWNFQVEILKTLEKIAKIRFLDLFGPILWRLGPLKILRVSRPKNDDILKKSNPMGKWYFGPINHKKHSYTTPYDQSPRKNRYKNHTKSLIRGSI